MNLYKHKKILSSLEKMSKHNNSSDFHIVMYPWFAIGHMTPFLHLSNQLAEKGFTISFLAPHKGIQRIQQFNLYPNLITFHPLTIPPVEGLPPGVEIASEIPIEMTRLLSIAMDRTRDQVEKIIAATNPKLVIYDMVHWIPQITKPLGIKCISYAIAGAAAIANVFVPARKMSKERPLTEADLAVPPPGYPSSNIVLRGWEVRSLMFVPLPYDEGLTFFDKVLTALDQSDAIALRTCGETEGKLCDYISSQYSKQVLLTGHVLPKLSSTPLENRWSEWLDRFDPGSVIYCAFGSEKILSKDQFQELVLGFESTGLPFLVTLKPPEGASTIEEGLPDGFEKRVNGRGVVWGGWVQQTMILSHPSVGCFVSHCAFGSMCESLMSHCQIVSVPHLFDQILNTRLLVEELKVAVEVERDENGRFCKENVCKAILSVMNNESEVGSLVKKNHEKLRKRLLSPGVMSGYVEKFIEDMQDLVKK